jgi:hypothetical protein
MQLDQLHPRIQATEPETGLLTPFFFRWLVQLYERVGGPDDFIVELQQGELSEIGLISSTIVDLRKTVEGYQNERDLDSNSLITELQKKITELQIDFDMGISNYAYQKFFKAKEINANYTTKENEILICTSNITVTLNTTAKIGERVYIKRTNGQVTVVGTIDNKSNLVMVAENSSVTLLHTTSGWWIL